MACSRALESAGFEKADGRRCATSILQDHHQAFFGEWVVEEDSPEVPAGWPRAERWTLRVARARAFPNIIVHLEARALLTGLQRVAESFFEDR